MRCHYHSFVIHVSIVFFLLIESQSNNFILTEFLKWCFFIVIIFFLLKFTSSYILLYVSRCNCLQLSEILRRCLVGVINYWLSFRSAYVFDLIVEIRCNFPNLWLIFHSSHFCCLMKVNAIVLSFPISKKNDFSFARARSGGKWSSVVIRSGASPIIHFHSR